MRALLVEDDAVLAEFVGGGLREAGFMSTTNLTAQPASPPP
jgi:DNA-binding response OmpR family regulator